MSGRRTVMVLVVAGALGVAIGHAASDLMAGTGTRSPERAVSLQADASVVVLDSLPRHELIESSEHVLSLIDPEVQLTLRSSTGAPLVVGVAPSEQVTTWLGSAAHERAAWIDLDGSLTTISIPGKAAIPTGPEPVWLDLAEGTDIEVSWAPEAGSVAAVVWDPTGTDVDASVSLGLDGRLGIILAALASLTAIALAVAMITTIAAIRDDDDRFGSPLSGRTESPSR